MAVDDEALGKSLERLAATGGASEFLPPTPGMDPDEQMLVAEELLRRGWIDAAAELRGDGRLFMARNIRMTAVGAEALQRLRATVGRTQNESRHPTPLGEKRRRRLEFMNRLYEITNGSRLAGVDMWELGAQLAWDRNETDNVVEYLEGEGLLEYIAMGGEIGITHRGVLEVEQALEAPDQPTEHFPPAVNIITVENMFSSQIQQGAANSSQVATFPSEESRDSIRAVLTALKADLPDVVLDEEDQSELDAEIGTIETQLNSSRPKSAIIRSSMGRVAALLSSAALVSGSAVELASHIEKLHQILPGV